MMAAVNYDRLKELHPDTDWDAVKWMRAQRNPRWRKDGRFRWLTRAWECDISLYWVSTKRCIVVKIDGERWESAMSGYLLRDAKGRALSMAYEKWEKKRADSAKESG